jgi:hypothetical protein
VQSQWAGQDFSFSCVGSRFPPPTCAFLCQKLQSQNIITLAPFFFFCGSFSIMDFTTPGGGPVELRSCRRNHMIPQSMDAAGVLVRLSDLQSKPDGFSNMAAGFSGRDQLVKWAGEFVSGLGCKAAEAAAMARMLADAKDCDPDNEDVDDEDDKENDKEDDEEDNEEDDKEEDKEEDKEDDIDDIMHKQAEVNDDIMCKQA